MTYSELTSQSTSICQPLWRYGLFCIDSEILVESNITVAQDGIFICKDKIPYDEIDRIIVVGAGKAGAGMTRGLLKELAKLKNNPASAQIQIEGQVNVPDNCVEPSTPVVLHPGRPASVNEPTPAGQQGAKAILEKVRQAGPRDLVIGLISGGGSALTPLPVPEVSLEDKQKMTRFLSRNGASINELNLVRSAISQIKGGGLVKSFGGHSFYSLIISDVLGNPLETIASGMTVPQTIDYQRAHDIIQKYDPDHEAIASTIVEFLRKRSTESPQPDLDKGLGPKPKVSNHIIGDNKTIVDAVTHMGQQLGYEIHSESAQSDEGPVEDVADRIWAQVLERVNRGGLIRPCLFVSGGEPTVTIKDPNGKGGRNQHLVLLWLSKLLGSDLSDRFRVEFVSLGTDGEDGPTDAAGAFIDETLLQRVKVLQLDIEDHLARNDSYPFFQKADGLVKTGPTHTNVCDLRLISISPRDN